jgi:hypothetical protein
VQHTLYPQKLALTSRTSGGRSVGIVCLRTKATEFSFYVTIILINVIISWHKQNTKVSGIVCSLFNDAVTNSAHSMTTGWMIVKNALERVSKEGIVT